MSANRRRVFVIGVGMTKVRSHLGKGLGMMLRGEVIPRRRVFGVENFGHRHQNGPLNLFGPWLVYWTVVVALYKLITNIIERCCI